MPRIILLLLLAIASANAAPFSASIPLPSRILGGCVATKSRWIYQVFYDSVFGGHWSLTGTTRAFTGSQWRESFSGTISDRTINGTFTEADFAWASDSYNVCKDYDQFEFAVQFKITINNGTVTGTASYPP